MHAKHSNLIFFFGFFTFVNTMHAMQKQKPTMVSNIIGSDSLYNHVPSRFRKRPLVYYKALTRQRDNFSCGHRAIFHALTIERAAKKARIGDPLEKNLPWLLKDQKSLSDVYRKITRYINETEPDTDQTLGLYDHQIHGAIQKKIPMLKDKLIPIFYEADDTVTITHSPNHNQNTLFPDEYFESEEESRRVEIKKSKELFFQLSKLKEPFDTTHFVCLANNHWILTTVMLNKHKKAKLVVIDSANQDVRSNKPIFTTLKILLECVEEMNQQ